jgi:hypothetical protein
MYFCNHNKADFNRFVEFFGNINADSISETQYVYLNLEDFIFPNSRENFSNHNLSARELNERFNSILHQFSIYEKNKKSETQFRFLGVGLKDVKSTSDEQLFRWSYYNHKFAASQGQDIEAMDAWHKLEQSIDINKIARFKARREANIAHYMHIIKNAQFFSEILFGGVNPQVKNEIKFGLDIAEEQYLEKLIKENKASAICRRVSHGLDSTLLAVVRKFLMLKKLNLKTHIVSTSKNLNPHHLYILRNILAHLSIVESTIQEANFVILVNDLDTLGLIPVVDTDMPIFACDLSQASTPNFSYLLLKDQGFNQIYAYAKKKISEDEAETFIRSICAGLMSFICKKKFKDQISCNYLSDYFYPLAGALGKDIAEFKIGIALLDQKVNS